MYTQTVPQSVVKKYEGNFDLQERVHELLEQNNSDSDACLEVLSTYGKYVKDRVGELTQRKYPKFIEYATKLDVGAQSLLKVKEGVISLRTTIQQVADLDLCDLENNNHLLADEHDLAFEETSNDKQQVDDLRDAVELAMFESDFEKAVSIILSNREIGAVPERELWSIEKSIVEQILETLRTTPGTTRSLLKILIKLDREDIAINHFFAHRSRWVRSEVCRVRFLGDVVNYARDSSSAIFSGLAATYVEYVQMAENDFKLPPNHLKSSAVRWISRQIDDFLSLIISQLMSVDAFSDIFQSFTEVFKACRDHLESLGIDMLDHIHSILKEEALQAFEKEITGIKTDMGEYLADADKAFRVPQRDTAEEIHAPPLWTRASRSERLYLVIADGTYELLTKVSSIVQSVKLVSLDGDKPWGGLEEATDTSLHDILKEYVDKSFELTKTEISKDFTDQQTLFFLSDMNFIASLLLPRVSQSLRRIFNKEHITTLDHLRDKFKQSRFVNLVVGEWTKMEVQKLSVGLQEEVSEINERMGGCLILTASKTLVLRAASIRYEAMHVMSETEVVDNLVGSLIRSVLEVVFDYNFWIDLIAPLDPNSSTAHTLFITNISFLSQLALTSYSSKESWDAAVVRYQITDEDLSATKSELDRLANRQGGERDLFEAIRDLDPTSLENIVT